MWKRGFRRGRQCRQYFSLYTSRGSSAKSGIKKQNVEVRVYLLSMMWHGWWKVRMWGNAHNDWRNAPRKQQFGQRRMLLSSTSKKRMRCCSHNEERIRNRR